MFYCESCERIFDEPHNFNEYHPYGEGYAAEKWSVCPYCGSGSFVDATRCEVCGEWCGDSLCKECEKEYEEDDE